MFAKMVHSLSFILHPPFLILCKKSIIYILNIEHALKIDYNLNIDHNVVEIIYNLMKERCNYVYSM